MSKSFIRLVGVVAILIALLLSIYIGGQGASNNSERAALVALYNATDGPNWRDNTNWLSDAPVGEWFGVTTVPSGRVIELNLALNSLKGEVPPELGSLSNLRGLHLGWNKLSGDIPPELGNFSNLQYLFLFENQLSGEIPPELGSLSSLQQMLLFGNQLSGQIPPDLGRLSNLQQLLLEFNQLSGEIPTELGNLYNLQQLHLFRNQLSGQIPIEMNSLPRLRELQLSDNQFSGCIPTGLLHLKKSDLTSLRLSNCSKPEDHEEPPDREALVAFYNALNGAKWHYSYNWLSDAPIGRWFGVTVAPNGRVIELESISNRLNGRIPPELASLSNLTYLNLSDNWLAREIPPELANLSNLTYLNLSNNLLIGEIPQELATLANLRRLYLGGNQLTGCIPNGLREVEHNDLETLDLPDCS